MRQQAGDGARAGRVAVLAVAGLLLVVLLAVWAASIGRDAVLSGDGPGRREAVLDSPTPTPSPTGSASPRPETVTPSDPPAVVAALAWLVVGAFWLLLAGLGYLLLREVWRRARAVRRDAEPDEVEIDALGQPASLARQMERDASVQRAILEEGEPRTAIEACWQRFEVQAREAGLPREPWETSSEFTYRMLDLVGADPAATSTLARLYREARFSEHPMGEESREAARAALAAIQLGSAIVTRSESP